MFSTSLNKYIEDITFVSMTDDVYEYLDYEIEFRHECRP